MEKVIVSGLLIIASIVAAVLAITVLAPSSVDSKNSILASNQVANNFVGTNIDGLNAVPDGGNGLGISAWFKNVGSVDVEPISAIDVFLLTGNRLSGRYISYSDTPTSTDRWEVVSPQDSDVWARGETLLIRLNLEASRPLSAGRYLVVLTTPNGVTGEIFFEYAPVLMPTPAPTAIPMPTPTLAPTPTSTPAPASAPVIVWEGLKGYLHGYASSGRSDHGYGLSYYTGIWSTFEDYQLDHYQRGHGTWITPDNTGYEQPLCPVGTVARDNWPERGPSYRDVFQTIEGGPGYWGNTRFPDRQMKYRLNAVTDCYTSQTSSPGWNWGGTSNLENQAGFAQLSNRLLYPPDGMTFRRGADGKFLGQAWMTLPLTLDNSQTSTVGANNWTLFLNAANYSGPTVYMTPEGWNRITDGYAPAEGRGLDTLLTNSTFRSLADEIGRIRSYEVSNNGQTYSRIPRMKYPVDSNQRTIFHQDVKFYSSDAIYDSITTYFQTGADLSSGRLDSQGTVDANVTSADFGFKQNGKTIRGLENIVQTQTFGDTAWGFNWIEENSTGVFPQYFVGSDRDDYRTVISETEIPTWTGLLDVTMPLKSTDSNRMYEPPSGGWPQPEGDQTYSVDLIDGSTVTYGWYKFIDQPSIVKLNLSSDQSTRLQSVVETIHALNWGTSNPVLAPPTFGNLVEIDDALLLTPPVGMNIGYVPVALRQYKN
jgi:hypothetical protein